MNKRRFIKLLGSAAAWPLVARAQQPERMRRIGVLMGVANNAVAQARTKAFQQELERLGWTEGRNIAIDYRWADGRIELLAGMAAELVRLKVDVIVADSTQAALAAKQATSVVPIVFVSIGDPVGAGVVASLARPGGNVTGQSNLQVDLAGKRLELLREIVPALRRLAILGNVGNPTVVLDVSGVQDAARALGLEIVTREVRRAEDIGPAFEGLNGHADALYANVGAELNNSRVRVNTLALAARLPTIYADRDAVEVGGLMSYGSSIVDQYRRTGDYVDKILRGTKPGDIPVEQPTKFELVVNLTTAKALGLAVPPTLLALADEVIE